MMFGGSLFLKTFVLILLFPWQSPSHVQDSIIIECVVISPKWDCIGEHLRASACWIGVPGTDSPTRAPRANICNAQIGGKTLDLLIIRGGFCPLPVHRVLAKMN